MNEEKKKSWKEGEPCSERASIKARECSTTGFPVATTPDSFSWTSSAVALAFKEWNKEERILVVVLEVDRKSWSRWNGTKGEDGLSEKENAALVQVPPKKGRGKVEDIGESFYFWKGKEYMIERKRNPPLF